jgi:hypothetical protein
VKYALLLYESEEAWQNVGDDRMKELYEEYAAVGREPETYGGAELQAPVHAKTVRADLVTDGPFTETKEAIAGIYLIDAADEERAIELARRIPTVSRMGGAIEIRPLVERR